MKLTKEKIFDGTVNVKKTSKCDIHDLVRAEGIPVVFVDEDTKAEMLNKIADYYESESYPAVVERLTTQPPMPMGAEERIREIKETPPKPEPVAKTKYVGGHWGLGYRENGEHICPTWDGSPDKGSNAANRGEA